MSTFEKLALRLLIHIGDCVLQLNKQNVSEEAYESVKRQYTAIVSDATRAGVFDDATT